MKRRKEEKPKNPVLAVRVSKAHTVVNVSRSTMSRWRKKGLVHEVTVNGVKLIRMDVLDKLLT